VIDFKLDHVALYVSDLEVSAAFYKSLFQLEPIPNPFPKGKRWFKLSGQIQLHLIENEMNSLRVPERSHICFSVSSFELFIHELNKLKIPFSDFDGNSAQIKLRPDGIRQIYFQDPDGYWWEVNDGFPLK